MVYKQHVSYLGLVLHINCICGFRRCQVLRFPHLPGEANHKSLNIGVMLLPSQHRGPKVSHRGPKVSHRGPKISHRRLADGSGPVRFGL